MCLYLVVTLHAKFHCNASKSLGAVRSTNNIFTNTDQQAKYEAIPTRIYSSLNCVCMTKNEAEIHFV